MSGINRSRQRLTSFIQRRETPDNLWTKCRGCGEMLYTKDLEENLYVCPECGFHERIGAARRFDMLFDEGEYQELVVEYPADDPLGFVDSRPYPDRLRTAREATGEEDALLIARGRISGHEAIVGVQDFAFMGGSMGIGVGSAFATGAKAALDNRLPYILCTAAGGARMQEGILSLMQMPSSTVSIQLLREAGLPYIVVLTVPTTGGVTASYAMLGDIQIAEPGALIGFAGARVIESTIREKLPPGFQRAEYLLEHGMVDMVVKRHDLAATLGRLIGMLCKE